MFLRMVLLKLSVKKYSFAARVINDNDWNSLPSDIVMVINSFKTLLDVFWLNHRFMYHSLMYNVWHYLFKWNSAILLCVIMYGVSKQWFSMVQITPFYNKLCFRGIREITIRWSHHWKLVPPQMQMEIFPQALASSAYQLWITLLESLAIRGMVGKAWLMGLPV